MNENLEKCFSSYSASHQLHFQQSHTEPKMIKTNQVLHQLSSSQEKASFLSVNAGCNTMDLNSKLDSLSSATMEIFNNNN